MKITFHGSAGTVTGSRLLCETSGKKFLIDGWTIPGSQRATFAQLDNFF
jgi:Cft2 family RNA processing exonuclease